ncbi:DUF3450 domain-containing protein [Pontibacterium granulatum]|uniref:DUF3450 domain-containing protein n=1 Tax=Pontibacterium granulatum TaxID=2036029 RepID=UPI00249C9683|nr:DUF3450 domain-containing protein [Pontibacterium granulatum]MDI3324531.1 DUF3450 domain-containing protein [Pontibacterium granulatum]
MKRFTKAFLTASMLGLGISVSAVLPANPLTNSENKASASHMAAQKSQSRIDQLDLANRDARTKYLNNARMADVIEAYNRQMQLLVASQESELSDLELQLKSIEETDKTVLPMLNSMVDTLQKFVAADLPFLIEERTQRIAKLKAVLLRADVSVAEKYRQILEAYVVEVQYGRTFEAYSGHLTADASRRQVNFLRLGRTALYFQTLGGQESGMWLPSENSWQALTEEQNLTLRRAIQIAQQQQVPSLINLPLPFPEVRS